MKNPSANSTSNKGHLDSKRAPLKRLREEENSRLDRDQPTTRKQLIFNSSIVRLSALLLLGSPLFSSGVRPALGAEIGSFATVAESDVSALAKKKTTLDILERQFRDIEEYSRRLEKRGDTKAAEKVGKELEAYRNLLTGSYSTSTPPLPVGKDGSAIEELHYVSGNSGPLENDNPIYKVTVKVTYGAPISLLLGATNSVAWKIDESKDARIEKIELLSRFRPSTVEGASPSTKLIEQSYRSDFADSSYGSSRWRVMRKRWESDSERLVTTLLEDPHKAPCVVTVGPENPEWRAQHILWRLNSLHVASLQEDRDSLRTTLDKFKYFGLAGVGLCGRKLPSIGELTIAKPIGELEQLDLPVFAGVRMDASSDWYLLARDGLIQYSPKDKSVKTLPVPADLPDLGFCTGITCDTKRNKILVSSIDLPTGDNQAQRALLHSYEPATGKWSILQMFKNLSLEGLAYSSKDDSVYTMLMTRDNQRESPMSAAMYQMNSDGSRLKLIPISSQITESFSSFPIELELHVVDSYLVAKFQRGKVWAFDRRTGRVLRSDP